jgi:hypothetical protein
MSFIASMVAASAASAGLVTAGGIGAAALGAAATGAAGAGIGAGISAATGGDIGEGALMGGIGGLGAGAGAALSGASMGASAIGAQGAAATPFAAAPAATTAATAAPTATTAATAAPTATATAAPTTTTAATAAPQTASQGINQMLAQGSTQTASQAPTQTASQGISSMLGESTTPAQMSAVNPVANSTNIVGSQEAAKQAAQQFVAQDAGWGSQLLNKAGMGDLGTTGNAIGGKALENAVYGAGINGLLAGAQGKDVGRGMLTGAVSGGVGGAAAGGLGQMGGTVGQFATNNPGITSALVGGATNMALDSALTSNPTAPEERGIRANVKWNPSVYRPYGPQFAAGGITDLDNYDQSPQMQSPGTLDIPNRNEVSNNQGYMGDSVQMMAHGGISDLGGYSDGGRLLKGPGDGVSDDIPATIGGKQPARLATGEFVVPARIVSELGNGSTDAGAKRLYQMMDRIQSERRKTTGKGKFSDNPKAYKHLPA